MNLQRYCLKFLLRGCILTKLRVFKLLLYKMFQEQNANESNDISPMKKISRGIVKII